MHLLPRIQSGILALLVLSACKKEAPEITISNDAFPIPAGFPKIEFPDDNQFTIERWKLGKKLFYEKALSLNNTVSCGSCHNPELAFSDDVALSLGDSGKVGRSNAPTLANVAYHPYFTRAGGVPTLEMQILVPIQEHDEFNTNIVDIAERLKQIPEYVEAAQNSYNREMDPFVITRAIAAFERSLISGNSRYDAYIQNGDFDVLNDQEKRGLQLFLSDKTNCSKCHTGFDFTNYAFENNGLYTDYTDLGRFRVTGVETDRAKFKVPSLRNIELTAPYMHDGSMLTLESIVEHYNSGGAIHPSKSQFVKPLGLTQEEKDDLVAFLKSLTDAAFAGNSAFRP
jgi:cytochrome c peroxidase